MLKKREVKKNMTGGHFPKGLVGGWMELSAIQHLNISKKREEIRKQFLTDIKFLKIAKTFCKELQKDFTA